MKENVLDVLMYLFETYVDTDEEPEADHNELRDELARAGFGDPEIDRALDWLDGLTDHQEDLHLQRSNGTWHANLQRLRAGTSRRRLSRLHLVPRADRHPVAAQREILVDRLLALDSTDIDVEQIKWVVLMVLFSQPGQEQAYARMEDLVFEENTGASID